MQKDAVVLYQDVEGKVELETCVAFSYDCRSKKLIEDLNLQVKAGTDDVAIVGPTGCGKTTTDQSADALL